MKPRFLLLTPYLPWGESWRFYEIPMGIAYISATLKTAGYEGECINVAEYNSDYLQTGLARKILSSDIVLTGGLSPLLHSMKGMLEAAKQLKPNITTILGGGIVSSDPELAKKLILADAYVAGEGESVILDIFSKIDKGQGIASGSVWKADKYVNMDTLPFPDYAGVMGPTWLEKQHSTANIYLYKHDKPRAMPIVTTRGCPYSCSFCFSPLGRVYRERSLDNVFKDVELLCSLYNINILNVHDEVMSLHKDRLYEFCKRIKKYKLDWITELRVNTVDRDIIKALKDAGCYLINFGIESTHPDILKSLDKRITKEQIETVLGWCYEKRIGVAGNILMWDKAETLETFRYSLKWLTDNIKYTLSCCPLQVYPGSPIYKEYVSKGIIEPVKHMTQNCPFPTKPPNMSMEDLNQSGQELLNWRLLNDYIPGKVLSHVKVGEDQLGELYNIKVVCPHCNSEQFYRDVSYTTYTAMYKTMGHVVRMGCRNCNWRFDIKRP